VKTLGITGKVGKIRPLFLRKYAMILVPTVPQHKTRERGALYVDKYNKKKNGNKRVAKYTSKHLPVKSQDRVCSCGNWIQFFADHEVNKLKVRKANFCKNRFCPMCAWRLAHKEAMQVDVLMKYLESEHDKAFIFATFTAPNVLCNNLADEITRYNKAFKKMMERKVMLNISLGYVRKLEVTYNSKRRDYHPHFHVLFAVSKSYFKSRHYMSKGEWLNLWRDVMGDPLITQVDVRKVYKNRSREVNEIAKYAAKDSHYLHSQAVFDVFYKALKGRQIITFNGMFAEANVKYKAGLLDKYKTEDKTEYVWLLLYRWLGKEYAEYCRQQISKEEYRQLKIESVDEMAIG